MGTNKEIMESLVEFLNENKIPFINLFFGFKIDREKFSPQLAKFCYDKCISFTFVENDSEYILYKV